MNKPTEEQMELAARKALENMGAPENAYLCEGIQIVKDGVITPLGEEYLSKLSEVTKPE
jgi:hypothetical protein